MSQSPLVQYEENENGSLMTPQDIFKNVESKMIPNSFQTLQSLHQQSPSSNGSLKASPQIYHSPQINSNKQKASKFNLESRFSPSLKNRTISQATINRGCNTPQSSFFKLSENTQNSPFQAESQKVNSDKQNPSKNSAHYYQNSQSMQILAQFGFNSESKGKKEESIKLPYIEKQTQKSVLNIKNKLAQLEDRQGFFSEVNKLSRKSNNQNTLFDQSKTNPTIIPDFNCKKHVSQHLEKDQSNLNQQQMQKNLERNSFQGQTNLTLQINKSPKINPSVHSSIFQDGQAKIKTDQRLTPLKHNGSISCSKNFCNSSKETFESDSHTTFKTKITPMKHPSLIFNYLENQTGLSTLQNIDGSSNTLQNPQGKYSSKEENKGASDIQSSQSFSSEDESPPNSNPQIKNISSQNRNSIILNKVKQIERTERKSVYFSPQAGSQTLRRRQTDNYMLVNEVNQILQNQNREEIISNLTSRQNQKPDKIMNIFQQQNSNTNSPGQINNSQSTDRATLMRQMYYLLPDIKKFVTEEIEKDEDLKSFIFQFYMMQDLNEFAFLLSQLLDHLAEQRQLTQKTFPNKFPKKILSKITNFIIKFLSQQKENSEQLKSLLNEQLTKSINIIAPSTLLEALGGYRKIRLLCEEILEMFQSSALTHHILIPNEGKGADKIEEFLLAVLQQDLSKTQKMIDELKKYSGTGFSSTEFYVMKLILYNYFNNHSYYSEEVKYPFFELLESLRYQFTDEEGFNSNFLLWKQADITNEMLIIWKQDPILSNLKESFKNSSLSFIKEVFDYTFSFKNCYQLNSAYQNSFSSQLDILATKSLHQMMKVATKRQGIQQNQVQMNINFLFKKLQWFIQKGNANYVSIVGNCQQISDQMHFIILNQKFNSSDSPQITSSNKESFNFTETDGSQQTSKTKNKFRLFQQIQQNYQLQNQQKQNSPTYPPLTDTTNFSQFLSFFFNFYSTFHYSDLVNFFKYEKCTIQIFQFWTQIFAEALVDLRGISVKLANEISKFIYDLFEFLKNN